jgi:hypothetical protein
MGTGMEVGSVAAASVPLSRRQLLPTVGIRWSSPIWNQMKLKEGGCCQNRNGCYCSCGQESDGVPASILMSVVQVMESGLECRWYMVMPLKKKTFFFRIAICNEMKSDGDWLVCWRFVKTREPHWENRGSQWAKSQSGNWWMLSELKSVWKKKFFFLI